MNKANRALAELKGVARTIPNENILISTLTLQEAKDSSDVENIVTTQDDLFQADLGLRDSAINAAAKEVLDYRQALQAGFDVVRKYRVLTLGTIKNIQKALEHNSAGFRTLPGTQLKRNDGLVVYTPPQDEETIVRCMTNLEQFINDDELCAWDPLVKMAVIHHQFESIHPFYDGNGRTGRIVNILYLVVSGLLDLPILYLSRYITHNKGEYYRLIQAIRDSSSSNNEEEWTEWVLFILRGVEETANETIRLVTSIASLMSTYKQVLRPMFGKQYRHELLNDLFSHPYTKIEYMERDLQVSRVTAAKYLNRIVDAGWLQKVKIGKQNYYINSELVNLFMSVSEK